MPGKNMNCNGTRCYRSPYQDPKIIWIMCLSTKQERLEEDTVCNIEAAINYIKDIKPELVKAIIISGDTHLTGKTKSVPEMMKNYIEATYPEIYSRFKDIFILEEESLTSRENIPYSLVKLYNTGTRDTWEEHVICTEKHHGYLLRFLLRYHLQKADKSWKNKHITIMPSQQTRLGWRGRMIRYFQKVEVRLFPQGKFSPFYRLVLRRRRQFLEKQY